MLDKCIIYEAYDTDATSNVKSLYNIALKHTIQSYFNEFKIFLNLKLRALRRKREKMNRMLKGKSIYECFRIPM